MIEIPYFTLITLSLLIILCLFCVALLSKVSGLSALLHQQNKETTVVQDRLKQWQEQQLLMFSQQQKLRSNLESSSSELQMKLMQQLNDHKEQFKQNN